MTKLAEQLRRMWGVEIDRPANSFEAVTRERADQLSRQVDRIELKLNGMILAVIAAVITEIYRVATHP